MTGRWTMTAGIAAVTAAALSVAAAGGSRSAVPGGEIASTKDRGGAKASRAAVENCASRSEAGFPGAFTSRRNLVVGPLAMIGAGGRAHFHAGYGGQKFPLLVRSGHRVTLELPRGLRPDTGLAYGPLPRGEVAAADAHRMVRFVACERGKPSGSSADGRRVTFWSGGVLASSARCVPLRVFVDGASLPREAMIRLGVRRCGASAARSGLRVLDADLLALELGAVQALERDLGMPAW